MTIPQSIRNQLLVEANHCCTICSEKCYELHHIVEQSEGGNHDPSNLIVLCPNCHQHRYHRAKEITREQMYQYKTKLKEKREIERQLLFHLTQLQGQIRSLAKKEVIRRLEAEIQSAIHQASLENSPVLHALALMIGSEESLKEKKVRGRWKLIGWEIERHSDCATPKLFTNECRRTRRCT
jgi:hypothetical protein